MMSGRLFGSQFLNGSGESGLKLPRAQISGASGELVMHSNMPNHRGLMAFVTAGSAILSTRNASQSTERPGEPTSTLRR